MCVLIYLINYSSFFFEFTLLLLKICIYLILKSTGIFIIKNNIWISINIELNLASFHSFNIFIFI